MKNINHAYRVSTMYLLLLVFAVFTLCSNCKKEPGPEGGEPDDPVPGQTFNHLTGVDHFGRSFPAVASMKTDRQVGMFYWPWIGQPYATGIWDATEIMKLPDGLKILTDFDAYDENISPNGQAHYWGKPLWGYYNSEDEWVIRKQIQMMTMAGVDFIYFDTTNAVIYKEVCLKVLSVIDEYIKNGWNPPRVVFYTHSHSLQTTRDLYREIYKPGHYPDTWYRVSGKPMIIAYTDVADDLAEAKSREDHAYTTGPLSDEILRFFHFAKPQWPSDPFFSDGFPWVEWTFPPPVHGEVINVSVASHPMVPMSFSLTRGWENWGRGWNPELKQNVSEDVDKGTFFQRQWDHVVKVDPKMVSVGGWNEWVAYKQPYQGEYMLCDAVDKEFSRDIEPMEGGYQDAFFLQLIDNVRRYKGVPAKKERPETISIDIAGNVQQWERVGYTCLNMDEAYIPRDAYGGTRTIRYTQAPPRDKLAEIKVADDATHLFFYIRFRDDFTPPGSDDNDRLNIFIGTGEPALKNWESYEYVVGRGYEGNEMKVGRLNGDFSSSTTGSAQLSIDKNIVQIRLPKDAVGIGANTDCFYFKVASGVEDPSDIMDYYKTGSSMPMGRLSYLYNLSR